VAFPSQPLPMGAPISFSVAVVNRAGESKTKVTKHLLCMHNSGSTPQS
jgi:hypothetical protein